MKRVGAVTIGQAPRTDVMEDVGEILRGNVELIQAGALDGLTLEEVQTLRPDGTGNTLVSRMQDGTGVMLQEQKILPLMQRRIRELEEKDVSAILILCTGEFPETFVSKIPLIYPSKVLCSVVASLNNISRIGIITPEAAQMEDIRKKWSPIVETVVPVQWNPYHDSCSQSAVERLRREQVDLAVMDCFGYSRKMRDFAAQAIGKPVILARTMAARVLLEIV